MRSACILFGLALSTWAQSFLTPFQGYRFSPVYENASQPVPYVALSFGGILVDRNDPNKILLGGNAAGAGAAFYSVFVERDYTGHVSRLESRGTPVISAPKLGSGVAYGPPQVPGALVYSIESGSGGIDVGFVKNGATAPSQTFSLVPEASSSVQFVPGFIGPDASGQFKLLTRSGRFYNIPYVADVNSFTPRTPSLVATLPVSNVAGFAYLRRGSPGFATEALLVAELGADRIAAYDVDSNGNPLPGTRRPFFTGLRGISGMTVDPLTADLLISTRMNSTSGIYRIDGFSAGPSTLISQCGTYTGSGVHKLASDLADTRTCLRFSDNVNLTLDCGGRTVSGGVLFQNVRVFQLRNCRLLKSGNDNPLTIVSGHYGEVAGNIVGDLQNPAPAEIAMALLRKVRVRDNTIAVRWLAFEDSQDVRVQQNNISCVPDAVYLVQSVRGANFTFDRNVLDGRNVALYGFAMQDQHNTYIVSNVISRFTVDAVALLGSNNSVVVSLNTVN